MRARIYAVVALLTSATALPLHAQQWHLEAQAGQIRSALDPAGNANHSVVAGLRYENFSSGFRISAGIPTRSDEAVWGAVAGAHRFAFRSGSFVAGLDASANAFGLYDRVQRTREVTDAFRQTHVVPAPSLSGFAGAIQGMPLIGIETPSLQAHLRAGASHYRGEFGETSRERTVQLADAQLTWMPSTAVALMPAFRFYRAEESDYSFAGITAVAAHGALTVWGSSGRWLEIEDQDATWAAGANLRLHKRAVLNASARSDALDPLYMTPSQTSWNVGLSIQVGGSTRNGVPVTPVFDSGRATIRLPVSKAPTAPRVAGDFTSWKPQPMERRGDNWIYNVTLQPGVYNFAFVDASGEWFVPEEYPGRKKDGMGGVVAVLVVQ